MNINCDMVDLGLPSGLKWAKCNLGAESETDYGLYFQWGSTNGYASEEIEKGEIKFNFAITPYYDKNTDKYSKYNHYLDNKVILDKYDDAVSKLMGLSYRMPTKTDFQELLANTTKKWVKNYKNSDIDGCLFTSNTNGNTLFFPAAGCYGNGSFFYEGPVGFVWSSSLNTSSPSYSWYLYFGSGDCGMNNGSRYYGRSLRGVSRISK